MKLKSISIEVPFSNLCSPNVFAWLFRAIWPQLTLIQSNIKVQQNLWLHLAVLILSSCKKRTHFLDSRMSQYQLSRNQILKKALNWIKTRALTSILTKYQYTYQVSVYWYLYLVFRFTNTDTDTSYFKNVLEYWYFQYFSVSVFLKNKKEIITRYIR